MKRAEKKRNESLVIVKSLWKVVDGLLLHLMFESPEKENKFGKIKE